MSVNVGKLVILTVVAIGLLVGLLMGRVGSEGWGLLGLIVGYLTGNGANAARGRTSEPVILPGNGFDSSG